MSKHQPTGSCALALLAGPLLFAAACTTTSPELVKARRMYDTARKGIANELVPARVLEVRQALDRAEQAHEKDDGSFEERSYAYLASRKAMVAIAEGETAQYQKEIEEADKEYVSTQGSMLKDARSEVEMMRDQLTTKKHQLGEERRARERAEDDKAQIEKQLTVAMLSLKESATVKQEKRGTVITLNGSVLFTSGRSDLLSGARVKLETVAEALKGQAGKRFVVEGHTDSRGSPQRNMVLSRNRAAAVREHLILLGVPADAISAVGRGPDQPVASNATPDGRANNRRVEIVVTGA